MQERFEDAKRVIRAINRRKTGKEVPRTITDNQEKWVNPSVHVLIKLRHLYLNIDGICWVYWCLIDALLMRHFPDIEIISNVA